MRAERTERAELLQHLARVVAFAVDGFHHVGERALRHGTHRGDQLVGRCLVGQFAGQVVRVHASTSPMVIGIGLRIVFATGE
ncbi:hypothetical protein D9M68_846070 [compost metagenome]